MFKRMSLAAGALALALCLGPRAGAYAQDQPNAPATPPATPPNVSSVPMPTLPPMSINWSEAYQLTPLEQKRLQAMGLSKQEAWAVAKAAHESGRDVDDIAQMVLRGRSYFQIAEELGIPYDSLFKWPARWQTPEWDEAVRAGSPVWIGHAEGTTQENRGEVRERRRMRRERRGMLGNEQGTMQGTQRAAAATCPVCHMQLATTASAANPRAVTIEGKTYYCCAGCDMSKIQQ